MMVLPDKQQVSKHTGKKTDSKCSSRDYLSNLLDLSQFTVLEQSPLSK